MWKIITKTTKPRVDTYFYTPTEDMLNKIQNYKDSGKLLSDTLVRSQDGLSKTYTMIWATKEDWEAYVSDPSLDTERQRRRLWNSRRGIKITIIDSREVDEL